MARERSASTLANVTLQLHKEEVENECLQRRASLLRHAQSNDGNLGPADLCHFVWTSTSGRLVRTTTTISNYQNVLGVDVSGPAHMAAFIQSLAAKFQRSYSTMKIEKGQIESFAISSNGQERSVSDQLWDQVQISSVLRSLDAFESSSYDNLLNVDYVDPLFSTADALSSFADKCQKLLWESKLSPIQQKIVINSLIEAFLSRKHLSQGCVTLSKLLPYQPWISSSVSRLIRKSSPTQQLLRNCMVILARAAKRTHCRNPIILAEQSRICLLLNIPHPAIELISTAAQLSVDYKIWTSLAETCLTTQQSKLALVALNRACRYAPRSLFRSRSQLQGGKFLPKTSSADIPFKDLRDLKLPATDLSKDGKVMFRILILIARQFGDEFILSVTKLLIPRGTAYKREDDGDSLEDNEISDEDHVKSRALESSMRDLLECYFRDLSVLNAHIRASSSTSLDHLSKHDWYRLGLLACRHDKDLMALDSFQHCIKLCPVTSSLRIKTLCELVELATKASSIPQMVTFIRELGLSQVSCPKDPRIVFALENARRLMMTMVLQQGVAAVADYITSNPYCATISVKDSTPTNTATATGKETLRSVGDLALALLEESAAWDIEGQSNLDEFLV